MNFGMNLLFGFIIGIFLTWANLKILDWSLGKIFLEGKKGWSLLLVFKIFISAAVIIYFVYFFKISLVALLLGAFICKWFFVLNFNFSFKGK